MLLALSEVLLPVWVLPKGRIGAHSSRVNQGLTHTAVTPLDLVKCRRQVDSKLYKGNFEAWGKIGRAEGIRGIFTGWGPTFFGYSVCFPNEGLESRFSSYPGPRRLQVRRVRLFQKVLLRSCRSGKRLQIQNLLIPDRQRVGRIPR